MPPLLSRCGAQSEEGADNSEESVGTEVRREDAETMRMNTIWACCRALEPPQMTFKLYEPLPPQDADGAESISESLASTATPVAKRAVRKGSHAPEPDPEEDPLTPGLPQALRASGLRPEGTPSSFYAIYAVQRIVDELTAPKLLEERRAVVIERRCARATNPLYTPPRPLPLPLTRMW